MLTTREMELLLALRDARIAYDAALENAIRNVSSDAGIARVIGVTRATVWRWRRYRLHA